jgi:hypothetical protein
VVHSSVTNHGQFEILLVLCSFGRFVLLILVTEISWEIRFCSATLVVPNIYLYQLYTCEYFACKTIKCLFNKNLFIYLKLSSTCQNAMFEVINLSYSIRFRDCSINATTTWSDEKDRKNATRAVHGKKKQVMDMF